MINIESCHFVDWEVCGKWYYCSMSCSLWPEVGQPDFAPPPEAIKATAEAAVQGLTSYTGVSGFAFCPV